MAKKFAELRAKMSPESRVRTEEKTRVMFLSLLCKGLLNAGFPPTRE
jgi:hypothetical protein